MILIKSGDLTLSRTLKSNCGCNKKLIRKKTKRSNKRKIKTDSIY
jgi:hypothetical protein